MNFFFEDQKEPQQQVEPTGALMMASTWVAQGRIGTQERAGCREGCTLMGVDLDHRPSYRQIYCLHAPCC